MNGLLFLYDVQPFLADCINKSFFAIPHFIFKIAALEYRSNFTIVMQNNLHIGFELGSDISSNLDLDDYFVFDKNPDSITAIFAGFYLNISKVNYQRGI